MFSLTSVSTVSVVVFLSTFNKMVCTNSTCLNGGVCVDGIACICPPGWQNDYVGYYHSQDCSLPSDFLPIFFVVCTVVTVICIGVLHYIARNARKLVWQWKIFYISWLVVDWMAVLAVYAEGGFFAVACIMTAIYSWVGTVVPTYIMMKILQSYFRLVPSFPVTIFTRAIAALVIGWNILTTGILIGAAVVSRNVESEQQLYHQLIIAWFLTQGGMNVIFLTVFLVFMNKLKRQIDSVMSAVQDQQQGNSRGLGAKHAVKRLGGITHSILGILPISCVNIIIGIMLLISDSVPYL